MLREEIGGYSEPPRPPRKNRSWVPIVLVALVGLGVAHVVGLTKPVMTVAMQLTGYGRPPGSRLVGDWESSDDPMFDRISFEGSKGDDPKMGFYMADTGRRVRQVLFEISSEDRSGRHVEIAEFVLGVDENYRVKYAIAADGKSMTRDYDDLRGMHVSSEYRYAGPPTMEAPPMRSSSAPMPR